ncbi:hypothetical protein SD70_14015 [Gordoniibacillus kamchatkensis]|uniref:Uncharacterized protein n=1 Tax=Gordoniibacillus kamchatkensis TaxID=1590651 RepID=A0ABR5AH46_9BACL|nr:hypothetical protein [Paenibacillus sp. VKM B-2647]KIL40354.1 hypothetical protein SD70_14015 [Paenibacillus sp. VKM B-2647]
MEQTKLCFFDDYWIDFRKGTVRRWFEPTFASSFRDPDFMANSYCSAAWCPEAGKYRLWYEVSPDLADDGVRYLALAESDDGIHYTIAETNNREEKRMRHIVFDGVNGLHGTSVIRDSYEQDPAKLYKCVTMTRMGDRKLKRASNEPAGSTDAFPVVLAFSPDGIHWTERRDLVAHPYTSDAFNGLFYNPLKQHYSLILRGGYVDRRIAMRTSKDLQAWSDPFVIMHPSPSYNSDATEMQFYSMWAGWMNGTFLGLLWRFYTSLTDMDFSKMWGYMETELVYSYDGLYWMQTSGRPVAERPLPPQYGCAQLSLMGMHENRTGDEYILYGSGARFIHGTAATNRQFTDRLKGDSMATVFFRIRKDGFCGIEGLGVGANVITKPMQFVRPELSMNIRANVGYVRFGLMEKDGTFFEGFSFDDCIPFEGDSCAVVPMWKEHKLEELLGEQVRVAVELNGAILHAMNVCARPYIRQPQASFSDPMAVSE